MHLRILRNRPIGLRLSHELTLWQRSLVSYGAVVFSGACILDALRDANSQTYGTAWLDLIKYFCLIGALIYLDGALIVYPLRQLEKAV